jgi:uncharacterized membrane protein
VSESESTGPALASDPNAPALSPLERRLVIAADRFVYWLTYHWLLVFNGAVFLFVALAFASPVLIATGHGWLGHLIFRAYHRTCHQWPERSFFVLGEQVAFCERDVGMYGGIVAGGLLYWLSGRRLALRRLRVYGIVFVLPLAVDGVTQLFGLRESNWYLRLSTGTWFGVATALLVYPIIAKAMVQTREELQSRFGPGLERLRRPQRLPKEVADGGSDVP